MGMECAIEWKNGRIEECIDVDAEEYAE